jgi:hypothetical protein
MLFLTLVEFVGACARNSVESSRQASIRYRFAGRALAREVLADVIVRV